MPWLRAFTQKISDDFSTLTWQVFVPTTKSGGKTRAFKDVRLQRARKYQDRMAIMHRYAKAGELREIPNHPILDLLTQGNEWFPGNVSMSLSQQYLDLVGELPWLLELNRYGMPIKSIPIPPTWISELPSANRTDDNPGYYRIIGPGAAYEVPAGQIFWAYHPTPANPFSRGTGLAQVLGDELETDEFAAKHTKDWFRNRAIPPVLISGLGMGLPELQRLEQKWLSKYLKVGNGWLPHFMNADVKVHQLSQTFQQQELGELRGNERDMIRMVFGIPPEQIGDVSNSNRSTIEASDFVYQSRVIVPRAEFFRAAIQERLVPLYDDRLVIDYISPVSEDREFMLKVRQAQPHAWELDEWRELGGSDALPNGRGKVHMMPFTVVPVRLGEGESVPPRVPATQPVPAIPEDTTPEDVDVEEIDAEEIELVEDSAAMGRRRKALTAAQIRKIVKAADVAVLTRRGENTLKAIVEEFGDGAITDAGIAISFDLADPNVTEFIRRWAGTKMVGVNATTQDALAATLSEGVANGESIAKLSKRIRGVYATATKSRALTIARTETQHASSFGAYEGMRQAGLEEKQWLATQDAGVRDTHALLNGQVKDLDEMFVVPTTKAQAMYPGDFGIASEDINCRCAVVVPRAKKDTMTDLAHWKSIEADRAPWVRMFRNEFRSAFLTQERAVLAALKAATKAGESCRRTA